MGNKLKQATILGMPFGTAMNQLRKKIMFDLLIKLKANICHQCSLPIDSIEQLSIEHIQPWERLENADLFWDLSNISFSHLSCNIASGQERSRRVGPEGTAWCGRCKSFRPVARFSKKSTRWNGLQSTCKDCKSKYKDW